MFRHADVVCLCLVCILWQFSMLHDLQIVNVVVVVCPFQPSSSLIQVLWV